MERVNLENLQKSKEEPSVVWSEYKNDCRHNPDMYFIFYEGRALLPYIPTSVRDKNI